MAEVTQMFFLTAKFEQQVQEGTAIHLSSYAWCNLHWSQSSLVPRPFRYGHTGRVWELNSLQYSTRYVEEKQGVVTPIGAIVTVANGVMKIYAYENIRSMGILGFPFLGTLS